MPRLTLILVFILNLQFALGSPTLKFRSDGSFSILQLADLHYGEGDSYDENSDKVQRVAITSTAPDLVVFSGDQVSAQFYKGNATEWNYRMYFERLIKPVQEAGIPYAVILGNHDDIGDLDRRQIVQLAIDYDPNLSVTQQGPANITGASNYFVDVLSSDGSAPAARIWFLDSMDRGCGNDTEGWGCVGQDTVDWVRTTATQLPKVSTSLAYIHIPIQEYMTAWSESNANGTKGEDISCPMVNTGVLQMAKDVGIQAIWSGHDHDNDFVSEKDGIRLGYARKTGYGNYGPNGCRYRGGTVVQLRQDESASESTTWIIQQDGEQVQRTPALDKEPQGECTVGASFYPPIPIPGNNRERLDCRADEEPPPPPFISPGAAPVVAPPPSPSTAVRVSMYSSNQFSSLALVLAYLTFA